ncbi:hypothetical protein HU200_066048 [Digitaria exilis]|uniref:Receptor kinase-like protein Xa21 n=1 Tax=Digitaria exilis TaxID=1010633 RepID=A0A835DWY5_9POAL|nr:hypothetical protein HU200_066048 [Digitaria exilis]
MLLAKLTVLIIVLPLLLCYGVGNVYSSTIHENREDLGSLLDFKQGISSDPNGALTNWTTSSHFCRWNGVNCTSTRPYRVRKLILTGLNLGGEISSSLGNLTSLNYLDLSNNSFLGHIPHLNKLQNLEYLYLGSNLLQSVIPNALTNCSNLVVLDLSGNNLNGVIPPRISFLTKLAYIHLDSNNLTGSIPAFLRNITNLQIASFSKNRLNGRIPDEVMQMPNLKELHLNQNNLSGQIPQALSNVSSLQGLSLTSNMLGSTVPSNIGDDLPNLTILYLASNNFEGHIPNSIGNPLRLEEIDLSINSFTGQIPTSLGNLSLLSYLNLERNMLQSTDNEGWEFFHALRNCSSLTSLSLSSNKLQGAIPDSIANLSTSLARLLMSGNSLSGIVPQSIGKFSSLVQLILDDNHLTGTIEEWVSDLTQLRYFSVAENQFTGVIPPNLGNLKSLLRLHLSYNNLQGGIPVEIGNLQLLMLNLSSNKLSGEIPGTLGNFENIQTIQMDQNILTGNVPSTFSNLHTLSMLNLSHNNLSGSLPSFLNDINSLTKLDLSYNNFEGDVPTNGVFDNATIISLDHNPGLCGGATDLHLPSCHLGDKRVGAVNYLVKILIPIFGFMSIQSFGEHFEKVTYNDLSVATRDFSESNLIGRGSHGLVYRGKLKESKMEVAVKVFDLEMRGAERSFLSECEALRSIQHRNLLPIITACSTVDNVGNVFKALVYELMPNGSLDTWLHHNREEEALKRLGLSQRISIAVNVADALDYLHHDCGRPTVHCDLKPNNILLDDDMNALLGDFGIARFYQDPQSTWAGSVSSIGVKGTIGYIPPEYGGGGHASTSGDVYSFGIVLLEIFTGKRPTDAMFIDGLDIIIFVENSFPDQIFHHVMDAHLVEECQNLTQENNVPEKEIYKSLVDLLQLALSCTRSLPSERPNMKQVASQMHAIKASQSGWKCK